MLRAIVVVIALGVIANAVMSSSEESDGAAAAKAASESTPEIVMVPREPDLAAQPTTAPAANKPASPATTP